MVVKHLGLVRATVLLSPIVAGCGSGAPAGYVGGEGDLSVATGPSSTATSMMVPSSATSAALNPTLPPGGAVVSPPVTDAAGLSTISIKHSQSQVLSRLTNSQFVNSAAALLGVDPATFEAQLPDIAPNAGYSNSGHAQSQPYDVVLAFDAVAKAMTDAVSDWNELTTRYGGCGELACVATFIEAFGERAFRRPLSPTEKEAFAPILDPSTQASLSYQDTITLIVRAFLQAPEFLYLFEDSPLTDFQLASRLAFFLTDGPPDEQLYAAAKAGTLTTPSVLEQQTDRLLTEHGERFAHAFVYDFFDLRKAYQRTVDVDDLTVSALISSLQDTFGELIADDATLSALLTTRSYRANSDAAAFLGLTIVDEHVTAPAEGGFIGLVTHPATLIAISNAYEGSMVSRGLFLAHRLMCIPPTPPPAQAFSPSDVAGELPANPTQRDEAEARLKDTNCLGCHIQFEPYAFALNRWAGDGRYKADERLRDGGPVRTSLGELKFTSYQDFFPLLAKSDQYQTCITDHLVQYALRHTNFDNAVTAAVLSSARQGGTADPTFSSIIRLIVQHPIFGNR